MKRVLAAAFAVVAVGGLVWAGQDMGGDKQDGGKEGMQMPQPTKEHEALIKDMEGTWDFTMKFKMAPDAPEQEAKGVETVTSVGGFWMTFDIRVPNMMMNLPWHGHGMLGYDPEKKKYVGTFINSFSAFMNMGEGTMDAAGKTLTMTWEGKSEHHGGKTEKMREVFEKIDKDNAKMTMYGPGPDGKEMTHFTATYKRKK
jgi:hypothetical protein